MKRRAIVASLALCAVSLAGTATLAASPDCTAWVREYRASLGRRVHHAHVRLNHAVRKVLPRPKPRPHAIATNLHPHARHMSNAEMLRRFMLLCGDDLPGDAPATVPGEVAMLAPAPFAMLPPVTYVAPNDAWSQEWTGPTESGPTNSGGSGNMTLPLAGPITGGFPGSAPPSLPPAFPPTVAPPAVPEPNSLLLASTGLLTVAVVMKRRNLA